jgi:ribosomal protein S18 acetylase RimI-like enzyme
LYETFMRALGPGDREWALEIVRGWGADFVVSRGRKIFAADLPGFCAVSPSGERVGFVTYEVVDDQCQLVTLHAFVPFVGIGTRLVEAVRTAAVDNGCRRLWLITTNDNVDALRFYQRRGFSLVAVHRGLREVARRLKPEIPMVGSYGIPIRDEVELEMPLRP